MKKQGYLEIRNKMKKKFLSMKMNEQIDIKRGLSTKTVIRLNTNTWSVDCIVQDWNTYYLNLKELLIYFNGNCQKLEDLILKLYDGYESENLKIINE